jgi:Na+/proline symporter
MKSVVALAVIGCVIVGTAGLGIFGVRKIKMDPTQFIVGGRSLGAIFLWLLMAGEVYTSFTFLGAAGWAYSKGAPAFYIICYLTVACIPSFFYLPPIWRCAHRHDLLTNADYCCEVSEPIARSASCIGRRGFSGRISLCSLPVFKSCCRLQDTVELIPFWQPAWLSD